MYHPLVGNHGWIVVFVSKNTLQQLLLYRKLKESLQQLSIINAFY